MRNCPSGMRNSSRPEYENAEPRDCHKCNNRELDPTQGILDGDTRPEKAAMHDCHGEQQAYSACSLRKFAGLDVKSKQKIFAENLSSR
jgi:hypothetical protein